MANMNIVETAWYDIYKEFCEWSPEHANMITEFRPWGSTSIAIWLKGGGAYKVKRIEANRFIMQPISKEDIKNKYGLI